MTNAASTRISLQAHAWRGAPCHSSSRYRPPYTVSTNSVAQAEQSKPIQYAIVLAIRRLRVYRTMARAPCHPRLHPLEAVPRPGTPCCKKGTSRSPQPHDACCLSDRAAPLCLRGEPCQASRMAQAPGGHAHARPSRRFPGAQARHTARVASTSLPSSEGRRAARIGRRPSASLSPPPQAAWRRHNK
jgi:hypothetical protein